MKRLEQASAMLGIVSFVGGIIANMVGNVAATWFMLAVGTGALLAWGVLTWRATPQQRHFSKPTEISSIQKNLRKIDASFLGWQQCTVMIWVLIPPAGQGLRNAPHYRYLLAHQTNDPHESRNCNLFALRYTPHGQWELAFTNENAQYPPNITMSPDGLQPGWHHFLVAWDHSRPELVFRINEGLNGEDRSKTYLPYWPKQQADNMSVGAWITPDPYAASYSETLLSELWICKGSLAPGDSRLTKHLSLRPDNRK